MVLTPWHRDPGFSAIGTLLEGDGFTPDRAAGMIAPVEDVAVRGVGNDRADTGVVGHLSPGIVTEPIDPGRCDGVFSGGRWFWNDHLASAFATDL